MPCSYDRRFLQPSVHDRGSRLRVAMVTVQKHDAALPKTLSDMRIRAAVVVTVIVDSRLSCAVIMMAGWHVPLW